MSKEMNYTGKAWKHHIADDFKKGSTTSGGAGKGATIFLNYDKMIEYLSDDGRDWYIAELELKDEPLIFEFDNKYMATTIRNIPSKKGFKPISKIKKFNQYK